MTTANLYRLLLLTAVSLSMSAFLLSLGEVEPVRASSGYLRTSGNQIVDSNGAAVRLSGLNWFGFETDIHAPHGLWTRNWQDMLDQVQELGYNTLRIPFSNAMLNPGAMPSGIDFHRNPDLQNLTAIEVLDRIIEGAGARGIRIILDNHRSTTGGGPEGNGLWYTPDYPEWRWISDWQMLAERYKGDPTVIGMDLRNEPFNACWGCGDLDIDWRLAAERAGNAILAVNPDLLIIVEGVAVYDDQWYWWGGNLIGAGEHPVRLNVANRLVYSPHDYPETVYSQPWFNHPDYPDNLPAVWDSYWGYLHNSHTAPILIGEFGTNYETLKDRQWLHALKDYIQEKGISWTFWTLNPNSGDTGGILLEDWITVHQGKQAVLRQMQYPFGAPSPAPAAVYRVWLGLILID
jgi:endoglucanase